MPGNDSAKERNQTGDTEMPGTNSEQSDRNRIYSLDIVTIPAPCPMQWEEMEGDATLARSCSQCHKQIFNLSAMSRADAEALLARSEHPCITYLRGGDGKILTTEPSGFWSRLSRSVRRVAAFIALRLRGGWMPGYQDGFAACGDGKHSSRKPSFGAAPCRDGGLHVLKPRPTTSAPSSPATQSIH